MANKTVIFTSQLYAGTSGLTAYLYSPATGSAGNGAGDAVTALSNGYFSFVVTEAITGYWNVVINNGATPILEGGILYFPSDTADTYIVDDPALQTSLIGTPVGARSVTITVNDGTNPIQNAVVRLSTSGETAIRSTDASGIAAFSLDDNTWTVSITATGFTFQPVTLVVNGTENQTYSMSSVVSPTPSLPSLTTGYWTVYTETGVVHVGAIVEINVLNPGVNSTGVVMQDAMRTATSDSNGLVSFTNMFPGATYKVRLRGSSRSFRVLVPHTTGGTVALGSIVG
jgi:hypothetical protein